MKQNDSPENSKASVQTFFDSTFDTYKEGNHSHIYELVKDSLRINSLNSTLFFAYFMASHGTDYTIIRDNVSKNFFILPHNRGTLKWFYDIETLSLLLTDRIKPSLPSIEPLQNELVGIEQFLNQSTILKKKILSIEQLDTLLQFKKTEYLGDRIYSLIQLDSVYEKVFPSDKRFSKSESKQISFIKSALKAKLETNEALIYFDDNFFLNVYEINPSDNNKYKLKTDTTYKKEDYESDFLNYFPVYNIRKIEIGSNRIKNFPD